MEEHVSAIKHNGLKATHDGKTIIETIPAFLPKDMTDYHDEIDTVILFTKAMQLDEMLQSITSILSEHTIVLCLLNGLGHEDTIKIMSLKKTFYLETRCGRLV